MNGTQIHIEPLSLGDEFGEVASYLVWAVLQWRNLYAKVSDKSALEQSILSL